MCRHALHGSHLDDDKANPLFLYHSITVGVSTGTKNTLRITP